MQKHMKKQRAADLRGEEGMAAAIIELAVIVSAQILGSHAFADLDHALRIAHIMNLANRLEGCTEEENIWYIVAPPGTEGWYLVPSSIGDVGTGKCWDQIADAQTVEEVLRGMMLPSNQDLN